jgi:hypothetical protein
MAAGPVQRESRGKWDAGVVEYWQMEWTPHHPNIPLGNG